MKNIKLFNASNHLSPWIKNLSIFSLVWLIGLGFGMILLIFYYPTMFHSDSATIQILAQAMADEMSLIPQDFIYGNQLILFRANTFIAAALKLGFSGYTAYVVGSSFNISFFFVITFITLETLFRDWVKSLFLAFLLFLPIGIIEADYIIGQQSHLANMVFALVIVVQTYRVCWGKERFAFVIASSVFFLMSLEEPVRAILVFVPLLLVILAYGKAKQSWKLILTFAISIFFGYVCNYYLVKAHSVGGLNSLRWSYVEEFLSRAAFMIKMFVGEYVGIDQVGGMTLSFASCVLYSAKFLVLVIFLWIFYLLAYRLVKLVPKFWMNNGDTDQRECSALEFIGVVGFVGTLFCFCAVMVIVGDVGATIRHFLWSLQLCKFVLLIYLLTVISCIVSARFLRYVVLLIFALQVSNAATFFLYAPSYNILRQQTIEHKISPLEGKIQELMLAYGICRIYGSDFWRLPRLEVLIPPMKVAVLEVSNDRVYFGKWLTRPSMRCVPSPVLYLFCYGKDGKGDSPFVVSDKKIAHKVAAAGGKILFKSKEFAIYLGPPVWDMTGCN